MSLPHCVSVCQSLCMYECTNSLYMDVCVRVFCMCWRLKMNKFVKYIDRTELHEFDWMHPFSGKDETEKGIDSKGESKGYDWGRDREN
jgi:hypothetical protein